MRRARYCFALSSPACLAALRRCQSRSVINHGFGGDRRNGDSGARLLTARSWKTPFLSAPDPASAADRQPSPARDRPARLGRATSLASGDSRARQPRARRGAAAVRQPSPLCLPDCSRQSSTKARSAISASQCPVQSCRCSPPRIRTTGPEPRRSIESGLLRGLGYRGRCRAFGIQGRRATRRSG